MDIYKDRRSNKADGAIKYLLNKHRDSLMQMDNERRRMLKEQLK